jgi:hypothetical protein
VLFDASFVMSAQKLAMLANPISTFYKVGTSVNPIFDLAKFI